MEYWPWLVGISVFFTLVERLWPQRKQKVFRKGIVSDLVFLVFNGHYLNVIIAFVVTKIPLPETLGVASGLSLWVQFILIFFMYDFFQWCVHYCLHNVPLLWRFHKVHHSIEELDWIGNMRFHWLEIVVYKSVLFVPFVVLGFSPEVLLWFAIFSTFMGHFNHSNLNVSIGALKYVFNSPKMHVWHHDILRTGKTKNYAINLSVWDWVFGTAIFPKDPPKEIGLVEKIPSGFIKQEFYPLTSGRSR